MPKTLPYRACSMRGYVAAAIREKERKVEHARVVMGGVAPTPWRAREAEAVLVGRLLDSASASQAADKALEAARPLRDNAYKIDLARAVIHGALMRLT